jgi:hypothetical protein
MASFEIPVGAVRRTQAGYARRGSRLRLHPCDHVRVFVGSVFEWDGTYVVQVDVDSSIVVEHKVSYRIGAHDGVRVAVERLEKPWVPRGY